MVIQTGRFLKLEKLPFLCSYSHLLIMLRHQVLSISGTFSCLCLLSCIHHHTWHFNTVVMRYSPHFISNRQFSMFSSSLSAWETMMEKSQGSSGIMSLRVTAATWFNETVCQKAKQQPVNKQAEVAHAQVCAQLKRMQADCQKLFFLSSFLPSSHTEKSNNKHVLKVPTGL